MLFSLVRRFLFLVPVHLSGLGFRVKVRKGEVVRVRGLELGLGLGLGSGWRSG